MADSIFREWKDEPLRQLRDQTENLVLRAYLTARRSALLNEFTRSDVIENEREMYSQQGRIAEIDRILKIPEVAKAILTERKQKNS